MPKLDTSLHLDMYAVGKKKRSFTARLKRAWTVLRGKDDVYGLEWGDPENIPPLKYVRDHYLMPWLSADTTVVEIGPGGGRWTRYMLEVRRLIVVDYHQELLQELKSNFNSSKLVYVCNNGDDFPGIEEKSVDLVFSFGVFVHLDLEIVEAYLKHIKPLLKPGANVVIQYADKTKPLARANSGFADNDPETMRQLVLDQGYAIREEDTQSLWHSAIIRFGLD